MHKYLRSRMFLLLVILLAVPCCTKVLSLSPTAQELVGIQTPRTLYVEVWQTTKDNFLWQDRLADWESWRHKFDGKLNTQAEADAAIKQLLDSLHDPYTYFKDPAATTNTATRSEKREIVEHRMLEHNVGYIRIRTFSSFNTVDEVEAALVALHDAESFVIDLRDNGGGYVEVAFKVFSMFVEKGRFTTMKGHYHGAAYVEELEVTSSGLKETVNGSTTSKSRPRLLAGNKPLVVLLNGNSASASEMISGALHDSGRAVLVGTQSFGKGIAQSTFDLGGGVSLQVTFAYYYFPGGGCIHKKGLAPDYVVEQTKQGDAQLEKAERLLSK